MGAVDMERQALNVYRMKLLGATVVPVTGGTRTLILQDADGQVLPTHSVSAGLDYPAVGPEHARLAELGRTHYVSVSDEAALAAFHRLAETEGIIPALETAHAVAWAIEEARRGRRDSRESWRSSGGGGGRGRRSRDRPPAGR